ncbi:MAG: hypothetical protein LUG85_06280 [Clostridiales bacterium]|nr:hypothetical protein [Clostridiales bacterium]
MKYALQKNNYRNFKIFRDNITEPRAYFIPFKTLEKAANTDVRRERYDSDMVTCLSGRWDFKFYPHCGKIPTELDTTHVKFDEVDVPSTWQRTGYQEPVYLNCPYEFKTMFPTLPEDMPAAIYRKTFTADTEGVHILTFLGAATNIEVYLNGKYVGYSEGTHNSAEFNVSDFLVDGENELVVLSFKWCCGSFLEAQDMFRENGIFRDILLTSYDSSYIYDYAVKYAKNGDKYDVTCDVDVPAYSEGCTVKVLLKDGDKVIASDEQKAAQKMQFAFNSLSVKEWNAEEPYLYTLFITLLKDENEVMSLRSYTGFKTVEIKENVFTFNGKNIKFKGVNHHDSNPETGYVMSHEFIENDLKLMKSLNVNAIRTSHYPPDPFMLILCDIYGFYVVDEADIETHGLGELCNNMDAISNSLKWQHHYVDRVMRMYKRDRNRACVTMWSLGNEAGGYKCQDKCYEYLKKEGTPIPVHYEGVCHTKRIAYDVVSEMYTHQDNVEKIGQLKYRGQYKGGTKDGQRIYSERPFFLCEYAHAMGVGPGAMEEYWNIIYKYDNLMGGCIWEWSDHAVYHAPDNGKYKFKYTYGGDHKEKQHDGNFCVDGLVYPDRTPHTGALQMKQVYRPIIAEHIIGNTFKFTNTNRFKSSEYLTIKWILERNGSSYDSGEISLNIEPQQTVETSISHKAIDNDNDYAISFVCYDGEEEVSRDQIILTDIPVPFNIHDSGKIAIESDGAEVTVKFDGGRAVFGCEWGNLISYVKNGKEFINQNPAGGIKGFIPNVFRAPIDNDMNIKANWHKLKLDNIKVMTDSFDVCLDGCCASAIGVYSLRGGKKDLFECMIDYTISPKGEIKVRAVLNKTVEDEVDIPRFGLTLELPSDLDTVEYYGRGSAENLPDLKIQSPMGIYKSKVCDMHEPYIYPQDNGEHCDVKWLKISDSLNHTLNIYAMNKLAFNVHDYTQQSLFEAKHQEELARVDSTVLNIDGYVRGAGTGSCGPNTLDKYKIDEDSMLIYEFTIDAE